MTALANGCPQQLADTLVGRSQVVGGGPSEAPPQGGMQK